MPNSSLCNFDSENLPQEVRGEAWRKFTSAAAVPIPEQSGEFRAWQKRWSGQNLHFRHTYCSRQLARYRKTRFHEDSLLVCYLQEGSVFAWDGSTKIIAKPGEVYLLDANSNEAFYIINSKTMAVTVPYRALQISQTNSIKANVYSEKSVISKMLSAALSNTFSECTQQSYDSDGLLEDVYCSLIKTLIFKQSPDDQARALLPGVRRNAIQRYIESHLDEMSLDSTHLEQAFQVSRATIARDFAEEGGVTRYIVHRRLERSLQELVGRTAQRGDISRSAARWGYSDQAHFSRAFRHWFGFTPSDAAALGSVAELKDSELPRA